VYFVTTDNVIDKFRLWPVRHDRLLAERSAGANVGDVLISGLLGLALVRRFPRPGARRKREPVAVNDAVEFGEQRGYFVVG